MSDIKNLSKITTRYTNKEGIAHPTSQKHDFNKPTVVHLSKKELEILYTTGQIETDGLTIIYEQ
jgi:hypothetical protein